MDAQRQELIFSALFEESNDALFVFHAEERRLLDANPAAERLTGLGKDDLLDLTPTDLFSACDNCGGMESLYAAFLRANGLQRVRDCCLRASDGRAIPVDLSVCRIATQGEPLTFVVARDASERHQREQERARLARAVEQADEAIVITDTEWNALYVNPSFARITGNAQDEALGRPLSQVMRNGSECGHFNGLLKRQLAHGETWKGRLSLHRKNGAPFDAETSISPVRDAAGQVINYVVVMRDVTQETALESQLRQAAKMEAIGQLAGGVAHDFNNLLTGILGYANLLKEAASDDNRVFKAADIIETAARRAMVLTQKLLGFSRGAKRQDVRVHLHRTIDEVIDLLERTIPKSIVIRKHLRADPPFVQGDPAQIQQTILNLAINARDAMPKGGILSFETERVAEAERLREGVGDSDGRPFVRVAVKDTGCGIPKEIQERIFEPFFTTKTAGQGTGMGLSMVYGIVKDHGGTIRVQSEPGRGAMFEIWLPAPPPRGPK
ncbi:MAG: PAS domain S-box protein [Candidatus Sumerlaeota bacterium]|nr:PAS domain S-box protein [Candidatus Sumerlaeota bacterium]